MIKKNTKWIIDGKEEDLIGGMPLSKGEELSLEKEGSITNYIVSEKKINIIDKGEEKEVNITYKLEKN
jgi:hypothetical protein